MHRATFDNFFTGVARRHLVRSIKDSLMEDGPDLTTNAVFPPEARLCAALAAKEDTLLAGCPVIAMVLEETARLEPGDWDLTVLAEEGDTLRPGERVAEIRGSARIILRAERVLLNFISHLSGIANHVARYSAALEGTGVRLLDTRKTLPGLRFPEKYAVLVGGGCNHRKDLGELLMLKDNHIDAAGGISRAVERLREAYRDERPIEVECRTLEEVQEAVKAQVFRIMLDNMGPDMMCQALAMIPHSMEVEISGGVTLENITDLARVGRERKADFISVGRLTHSAPAADFSLLIRRE